MYIRWKGRGFFGGGNDPCEKWDAWYAYLVAACRVDGKPRQRVIGYLGGLQNYACTPWDGTFPYSVPKRVKFWLRVALRLAELAPDVDEAGREKMKAALTAKVASPTEHERARLWSLMRRELRDNAARHDWPEPSQPSPWAKALFGPEPGRNP